MSWITENAFKCKTVEDLLNKYEKTIISIEGRISDLQKDKESFIQKYGPKETNSLMVKNHTISLSQFALGSLRSELGELKEWIIDNNTQITSLIVLEELKRINNV